MSFWDESTFSPISYRQIVRTYSAKKFLSYFGLSVFEFECIHSALQLLSPIWTGKENLWDSKTALLVYVAWLRAFDLDILEERFGWSKGRCLRIMKTLKHQIYRQWIHLLDLRCPDNHIITRRRMDYYEAAFRRETGVPNYWGSTDCSVDPTRMRDRDDQRWVRIGHTWLDGWKMQVTLTPDGIVWLKGPYNGFHHDPYVEAETSFANWAEEHAKSQDGRQLVLCGMQRHGMSPAIVSPFDNSKLSEEQSIGLEENLDRLEWSISNISRRWRRFRDYWTPRAGGIVCDTPNCKIGRDFLSTDYKVATLLWNALTCLRGNEISIAMGCNPPGLFEYFSPSGLVLPWVLPDPEHRDSGINIKLPH
ncbi:uncharacterized protein PSANT_01862 [Moesziomyces antarcticus]|uniref:DDE Tnp4 domain-containing protein n=2 Tax=Pseudozyma antarctica TaxID=84753 RepID=A0A5C3FKM7_PSEA2|nr:uncharacterized protein PSANT_01862 [Moesziomyces antarcticus]